MEPSSTRKYHFPNAALRGTVPAFLMKSTLTLSLVASLLASQALIAADPKKPAAKPAPEAKTKEAATPPAAPAVKPIEIKDPVAVVEGVDIKKSELDEALAAVLAQRGGSPGDIPEDQKLGAYRMLLDDVIIDKLIAKRSADIKITDAEVDETFKKFTKDTPEEEVKKQIEKSGQTLEKIKESIRTNLRQQRWVEEQIKGKDAVTDAEIEEFYKKNPDQFKAPERVRASHILIGVKKDATPEQVTEKEKSAKAIYERVKKGEDFAKLATELSEDPSAKQSGGDLDFFAKEQMVPEFSAAAFAMKKGDISEPVRSEFGYHIIKVTDRKEPEVVALEKAKPQLTAYLGQQKKQAEVEKLVRGVREKADVKINLPEPPAAPAVPAPAVSALPDDAAAAPEADAAAKPAPAPKKK
ncbi:MAG: peptidylprolyl isomerase [Chthoniobacteraceae bacterium]|nr:peptidylprolyl isomerase [Chthoniobacteraceae bacterium]